MSKQPFDGYSVLFLFNSRKHLEKLPRDIIAKIIKHIELLLKKQEVLDIKKLQNAHNCYRIRSGDYRIVYKPIAEKKTIYIVIIAHRNEVYKKLKAVSHFLA